MPELMLLPRDMHNLILARFDLKSAGRMRRVSKYWRDIIEPNNYDSADQLIRRRRINFLRYHNPFKPLMDKHVICKLPDSSFIIYEDIVKHYRSRQMCWKNISVNPNIFIQHIIIDPSLRDSIWWSCFCERPDVTIDIVLKYPDLPWSWPHLSRNANMTEDIITKFGYLPWTEWIASNGNLSIEFILSRAPDPPTVKWFYRLSSNPNLSPELLYQHSDAEWNIYTLARNIPMLSKIGPMIVKSPHIMNDAGFIAIMWRIRVERSENTALRRDMSVSVSENTPTEPTIKDIINDPECIGEYHIDRILSNPRVTLNDIIDDPEMLDRFANINVGKK